MLIDKCKGNKNECILIFLGKYKFIVPVHIKISNLKISQEKINFHLRIISK